MDKKALQKLSLKQLLDKKKSTKVLIGIFVPIILGLSFFTIRDYLKSGETDMASLTIIICSIGGMVSLFPQLKAIQEELKKREN